MYCLKPSPETSKSVGLKLSDVNQPHQTNTETNQKLNVGAHFLNYPQVKYQFRNRTDTRKQMHAFPAFELANLIKI